MVDFSFILQIFSGSFLTKTLILILIFGYIIFAIVILNQVRVMNKIVTYAGFSSILFFIALANLLVSIALFVYALLIL